MMSSVANCLLNAFLIWMQVPNSFRLLVICTVRRGDWNWGTRMKSLQESLSLKSPSETERSLMHKPGHPLSGLFENLRWGKKKHARLGNLPMHRHTFVWNLELNSERQQEQILHLKCYVSWSHLQFIWLSVTLFCTVNAAMLPRWTSLGWRSLSLHCQPSWLWHLTPLPHWWILHSLDT